MVLMRINQTIPKLVVLKRGNPLKFKLCLPFSGIPRKYQKYRNPEIVALQHWMGTCWVWTHWRSEVNTTQYFVGISPGFHLVCRAIKPPN